MKKVNNENNEDLNYEEINIQSSQQQNIVNFDDETKELLETDSENEIMKPEMSPKQAKLH